MKSLQHRLTHTTLPLVMLAALFSIQYSAQARTDRLVIENGDNSLNKEEARQNKEQWDDTRTLRGKVNNRSEKEFDKIDRAFDTRDSCEKSMNVNAYWEPHTLRCLDRRTGRAIAP